MNTQKSVMIRIPSFSDDNKKLLRDVAKVKRMSVGAYVASVLEREIKREARKNADC